MTPLVLPCERPLRLSDPHNDFSQQRLGEILATPDDSLIWSDYMDLFGPFLPAGTYQESSYFLPRAFDYIETHDDHALDLVTSLAWFISVNSEELREDHMLEAARQRMAACLAGWIREFRVIHFDHEACLKKGWQRLRYFDHVLHSETLAEGTCDLVRFGAHADLAVDLFRRVSREGATPVEAAWFLEFARQRSVGDVRTPPSHPEVTRILEDQQTAERSASIVASSLGEFPMHPSYWRDVFVALGIQSVALPEGVS